MKLAKRLNRKLYWLAAKTDWVDHRIAETGKVFTAYKGEVFICYDKKIQLGD